MTNFEPPLKLLIVDDHFVFRAGLKAVLSLRKDFQVVAEAARRLPRSPNTAATSRA
jgi:DNA-binding NarL/FixJ family response regulator